MAKTELGTLKTVNVFAMTADEEPSPLSFFSNVAAGTSFWYWKRRCLAILIRCARQASVFARMRNARANFPSPTDISMDDLEEAERLLIGEVQERHFAAKIWQLRGDDMNTPTSRGHVAPKSKSLRPHNPFVAPMDS